MVRRKRSVRRRAGAFIAEIVVVIVGLAVMLGIVIPWATGELTKSAQERFLPTASPTVSAQP